MLQIDKDPKYYTVPAPAEFTLVEDGCFTIERNTFFYTVEQFPRSGPYRITLTVGKSLKSGKPWRYSKVYGRKVSKVPRVQLPLEKRKNLLWETIGPDKPDALFSKISEILDFRKGVHIKDLNFFEYFEPIIDAILVDSFFRLR